MEENKINELRHEAENFASHVRHQNRAGMNFVSYRTASALATADYIAHLERSQADMQFDIVAARNGWENAAERVRELEAEVEQSQASRAQRTNEAAGQAGLAKLVRYGFCDYEWDKFLDRPDGQYVKFADVEALLAAPVAAGAEQASLLDALRMIRCMAYSAPQTAQWIAEVVHIADDAINAAPLATPADAGAGQPSSLDIGKIIQLHDESTDRDFGLLIEPFARAIEREVLARDSITIHRDSMANNCHYRERVFNQIVELDAKDGLSRFTRMSTPGAPVTAEPAQYLQNVSADVLLALRNTGRDSLATLLEGAVKDITTHSAPADRDAIRNEALEEVAKWYGEAGWLLDEDAVAEAIRALKSMERAADATETRDAEGASK